MSKDYKGMVRSRGIQPYVTRACPYADLDEFFFDELSEDGHILGLMGYPLDALDVMPSGSMLYDRLKPVMGTVEREYSLEETMAWAAEMDEFVKTLSSK